MPKFDRITSRKCQVVNCFLSQDTPRDKDFKESWLPPGDYIFWKGHQIKDTLTWSEGTYQVPNHKGTSTPISDTCLHLQWTPVSSRMRPCWHQKQTAIPRHEHALCAYGLILNAESTLLDCLYLSANDISDNNCKMHKIYKNFVFKLKSL